MIGFHDPDPLHADGEVFLELSDVCSRQRSFGRHDLNHQVRRHDQETRPWAPSLSFTGHENDIGPAHAIGIEAGCRSQLRRPPPDRACVQRRTCQDVRPEPTSIQPCLTCAKDHRTILPSINSHGPMSPIASSSSPVMRRARGLDGTAMGRGIVAQSWSTSTRRLYHKGVMGSLSGTVAAAFQAVTSAYSMLSASACHDDSMMLDEQPTVLHERWPLWVSMITRVMAPVAELPSRMRTL